MQRHTIEAGYRSLSSDGIQIYRLDPLHIANIEGDWYLFARSHRKGDVLQLAVSRISEVKDSGELFAANGELDAKAIRERLFGRYVSMQGKAETVKISVNPSAGIHLKQWHPDQKTVRTIIENEAYEIKIRYFRQNHYGQNNFLF